MALYEFFTSRNNGANVATYVGQAGRLFYDGTNGVLKISDGITPGGANIQLPVATASRLGGIKAGPGANVSIDGTLTIDTAGLPLGIGNISIVDTTISTVNTNADLILESNGTGNVELRGNIHFHTTANPTSTPFFTASNDGQITILVPVSDPLSGAVKIVGSATGTVSAPLNTGVMLQLTGNNNDASRFYNDAIGSFAAFVGRRINGNIASPTAVTAGQEIIRISATGYNGVTTPGTAGARINFAATENYTNSNFGSNIGFWACATGSNVLVKQATIDGQSGLTVTGAITSGDGISDSLGLLRSIPQNSKNTGYTLQATDNGQMINITIGNVTIPGGVFNSPFGQTVSIYNNQNFSNTIVQGTNVTLRLAGTASTGNRTLSRYGVATVICVAANTFVISGAGIT